MSLEIAQLPTIDIPFLYGKELVPVIDMSDDVCQAEALTTTDHLPKEKVLYGWLTIPMAARMVNVLLVDPMTQQGVDEGLNMARNDYHETDLAEGIAKVRKKMLGGSAQPPFVHILHDPETTDPEEEARLTVLVPTTQDKRVQNIFDLRGKYKILSNRGIIKDNPLLCATVLPEIVVTKNREAATEKLIIPGNGNEGPVKDSDNLPVGGINPFTHIEQRGYCNGTKL